MSSWFSIRLGDGMFASEPLGELRERFSSMFEQAGCPRNLALFVRHESEGRLHCEVVAYLPPASAPFAHTVEARPCPRPSPDGLHLVTGSGEAWAVLFPESLRTGRRNL